MPDPAIGNVPLGPVWVTHVVGASPDHGVAADALHPSLPASNA